MIEFIQGEALRHLPRFIPNPANGIGIPLPTPLGLAAQAPLFGMLFNNNYPLFSQKSPDPQSTPRARYK
jgi:hypothetical protein